MGRTVGGHARVDGPPPKKKICAFLMRRRFTRFRSLRGPPAPTFSQINEVGGDLQFIGRQTIGAFRVSEQAQNTTGNGWKKLGWERPRKEKQQQQQRGAAGLCHLENGSEHLSLALCWVDACCLHGIKASCSLAKTNLEGLNPRLV